MLVPASGAVITDADKAAMHAVVDAGWLTASTINARFEAALAAYTGIRHVRTCNSGSSANLLAVAAMIESGRWKRGDIIVTVAASFPTTINPLLLYGLVPMFVDIDDTLNVNVDQLWRACNGNVKGMMFAHTLGNPFDVARIAQIARDRQLWLISDCCDALGATFAGVHVGNEAHIATCSFFPAHHITTGEGGAVFTNDEELASHIESIRDWGRDCWCEPGKENTCGKRFEWDWEQLPAGFDHKYTYTRLGFNLKSTELSAACGFSQLDRLPAFVAARRTAFAYLRGSLQGIGESIQFTGSYPGAEPSWFGFPITLNETGIRSALQAYLAQEGVGSRLVFSGNITKQPYMKDRKFLVAAALMKTDDVMDNSLWIGCHPALSEEQLAYAADKVKTFLSM